MKNIAVVNLMDISTYFHQKIDGKRQLDRILEYAKNLPMVNEVLFLLTEEVEDINNSVIYPHWDEALFMNIICEKSKGFDHLFYFYGDCPLLDKEISKEMFEDHINYYAEYTFADGFPYGLTPEILDINILQALNIISKDSSTEIDRETIFNIVKKDINSFELETKIAEKDQRHLRVSLTTDTKRNYNQLLRILDKGGNNYKKISDVLENKPEILIVEPSYVTIEITKKSFQNVSYLPTRLKKLEFMELDTLDILLNKIKSYSDDATISFTPEYEPTTHPNLLKIITKITKEYNFNLFIETSGIGWTPELIKEVENNSKIRLIILLDVIDSKLYTELRGEGQEQAITFSKNIISSCSNRVWVQATRMKINENDMEPFYRYWQDFTDQIIIQKYSDYNGTLPDLKVADLSPLKRFPCWHLKRDMHINTEGEVLLCFNDINNLTPLGSLVSEDIETIMNKKREHYLKHINCDYSEFCRKCDEYYTFNF